MFQSPLKTVSEKIKPVDSKSSVSSLKFERPSDFKKFINFIKNETEELEKIKLPKTTEVESKSKRGGVLGLLGLGLFGLLGSAFGGGEEGDDRFAIGGGTRSQFNLTNTGIIRPPKDRARTKKYKASITQKERKRKKRYKSVNKGKIKIEEYLKKKQQQTETATSKRTVAKKFFKTKITPKAMDIAAEEDLIRNLKKYSVGGDIFDPPTVQLGIDDLIADLDARGLFAETDKLVIQAEKELGGEVPRESYTKKDFDDAKERIIKAENDLKDTVEKLKKLRKKRRGSGFFNIDLMSENPNLKIGGFSPKDFQSKIFTKIGTTTKPLRESIIKPTVKNLSKIKGVKFMIQGGKLLGNFGGVGLDLYQFFSKLVELIQGFRKGDNILTAYYDLGVAVHNMFQPDKAKLMTYITNHQDSKLKVKKQEINQKITGEIQKAKEAQALSGGFNPINKASDIVPFAVQKTGQQIMLSSPAFTGYRFILDKLYKQ